MCSIVRGILFAQFEEKTESEGGKEEESGHKTEQWQWYLFPLVFVLPHWCGQWLYHESLGLMFLVPPFDVKD